MSIERVRSHAVRTQIVVSGRALAAGVVIAYLLMFAAGTSHMSAQERAEMLLPWRASPVMALHVQSSGAACDFSNVVIGDGAVRTGSHCVTEQHEAKHERKDN
jgi:hypothetical protein